ncbi:MAG TPA: hypothetical protein IGR15_08705 [Synechococcus sp. M44_DOE_062]|nr:hypothetical protein [Synechococcus sp. M44_DOE_062]
MERPKWVAIVTGILAIALGVGYLLLAQLLDYRGGQFLPAPLEPPGMLGEGLRLFWGSLAYLAG